MKLKMCLIQRDTTNEVFGALALSDINLKK